MTVHLSRDYTTQYAGTNRSWISGYLIAIFLRRVLTYSQVGQTSFNINSVGPLLIATGDTTPTAATPTFPAGHKAGINTGTGTYHVNIPSVSYTVSVADVGRILVLKSTANPTFNSGLFLVTGFDTSAGRNDLIIDWRSGDTPPVEAVDTLPWYLYEKDSATPVPGAPNGSGGYDGSGSSTTPRVILQSPHATAWQVRICIESTASVATVSTAIVSVAPGFGGNSAGDFPIAGRHLHGQQWWNNPPTAILSNIYDGMTTGTGDTQGAGGSWVYRHYMIGDDTGQAVGWVAYSPNTATPFNVHFGICDNEPTPLPTDPLLRLFVIGEGYGTGPAGITYAAGNPDFTGDALSGGVAFGYGGQPVTATTCTWTFVNNEEGGFQNSGPFVDATRLPGDSPWTGSTDLLSVEIVAGALWSWQFPAQTLLTEPRTLGTLPFFRQGRSNFGSFTTTSDVGKTWMHTLHSVFMLYGGPTNIP